MAVALKALQDISDTPDIPEQRASLVDALLRPLRPLEPLGPLEPLAQREPLERRRDLAHGWTTRRRRGADRAIASDELQALLLAATEGADGLAWLTAQATAHTLLSADEERALAGTLRSRQATSGERRAARERMILANLRLVMRLAGGMQRVCGDLELIDVIEEGVVGLMRAVDRFDPGQGFRFSTYATWWIAQAMQRAAAQSGHAIRLPVYLYERRKRILRARTHLMEELRREPRLDELVMRCRQRTADRALDEAQVALLLACQAQVSSLDAPMPWAQRDGAPGAEELTLGALTAEPQSSTWFDLAEQSADARWLLEIAAYALGVRGDLRQQTLAAQGALAKLQAQLAAAQAAHEAHLADYPTPATAQRHARHARKLLQETQRLARALRVQQLEIANIRAFDIWATRALQNETCSLEAMGRRYGITRERVRQIELEASAKVRNALAEVGVTSADGYRGAQ